MIYKYMSYDYMSVMYSFGFLVLLGFPHGTQCLPLGLQVGIKVDDALAQETFARIDRGGYHKISWAELWAAMAPTPSDWLVV